MSTQKQHTACSSLTVLLDFKHIGGVIRGATIAGCRMTLRRGMVALLHPMGMKYTTARLHLQPGQVLCPPDGQAVH